MTAQTTNPDDILLMRKLIAESEAAKAASASITLRNWFVGAASVIAACGLSLAAGLWAWNQQFDPAALKAALASMPPLKVETTLKDGVVKLKDGAEVALKDGSTVGIDGKVAVEDGATVKVEGQLHAAERPDISSQPTKAADGKVIQRSVTVFTTIEHSTGVVMTGWEFANGGATKPQRQYCYFRTLGEPGSATQVWDIAVEAKPVAVRIGQVPMIERARSKCAWWRSDAPT